LSWSIWPKRPKSSVSIATPPGPGNEIPLIVTPRRELQIAGRLSKIVTLAAKDSAMATQTGSILRPLAVMMRPVGKTVGPDDSLLTAAQRMRDSRVGAMLVAQEGRFIGVVSEADLVRKAMANGVQAGEVLVRSVMSAPVVTVDIGRSAHDASDLMAEHGIRHLAVTEEGAIVGMISVRDLLRYFKNWGTL
jgi:CBS domain-containing protein